MVMSNRKISVGWYAVNRTHNHRKICGDWIKSSGGEHFDHTDTGGVGGQLERDAGAGDLVDRTDVDLEAHHLGLEIIFVADLGGDALVREGFGVNREGVGAFPFLPI